MTCCDRCGSSLLLDLSAKCSDLCHVQDVNGGNERDGYVPSNIGIGGGDYVEFRYCLECGKIQGNFPLANPLRQYVNLSPGEIVEDGDERLEDGEWVLAPSLCFNLPAVEGESYRRKLS